MTRGVSRRGRGQKALREFHKGKFRKLDGGPGKIAFLRKSVAKVCRTAAAMVPAPLGHPDPCESQLSVLVGMSKTGFQGAATLPWTGLGLTCMARMAERALRNRYPQKHAGHTRPSTTWLYKTNR